MTTKTITFRKPSELIGALKTVDASVSQLYIKQECEQEELPELGDEDTVELADAFNTFANLKLLHIDAHIASNTLSHPSLRELSLTGAIALTDLEFPSCEVLSLALMGDAHGVVMDVSVLNPLMSNAKLPKLASLDLRHVSVESHKRTSPKVLDRILAAPWFEGLRSLGLFSSEISLAQLKKATFDELDYVVVCDLLSPFDKNPIKSGKVWFESDASPGTLEQAFKAIQALPSLRDLVPSLGPEEFDAMVAQLFEAEFKIESESVLAALVARFCKKRQWHRMETLLRLVRKKSRTMRVFLDTLEKLVGVVEIVVTKKPDDVEGTAFLTFLRDKVAL